jgi:arylsulfatase A-like enzyme
MRIGKLEWLKLGAMMAGFALAAIPWLISTAQAQAPSQKPNIMFIMGDDIGWMQPSIYHRGLMVGETPNIDRIGQEGSIYMDYLAMQSCTSGRNAFFTGIVSAAHRHDPAATARQSLLSAPRHSGGRGVPA